MCAHDLTCAAASYWFGSGRRYGARSRTRVTGYAFIAPYFVIMVVQWRVWPWSRDGWRSLVFAFCEGLVLAVVYTLVTTLRAQAMESRRQYTSTRDWPAAKMPLIVGFSIMFVGASVGGWFAH